jgi:hypothetical protein
MYLQAGRPARAFRPFGDIFDLAGDFFDSEFGGAILKVGTGLASTYLQQQLGPSRSPSSGQQQFFPLYAPYNAQPGIVPQNVVATSATTQQQAAVNATSKEQEQNFTPWLVAGAVVLAVLILK